MIQVRPQRGDVWLIDFGTPIGREQSGRRPGVVVSDDLMNAGASGLVIVVPLTTRHRDLPSHVEIGPESGLDLVSYAKCEDVKSVSTERLIRQLATIGLAELDRTGSILIRLIGR